MTLKNYVLTFFLFSSIINYAQRNQEIDSSYVDYFNLTREIPYLHLNKTTFSKGQKVWFQAYILDLNSKKLHDKTTNLYVSLYHENGAVAQKGFYTDDNKLRGEWVSYDLKGNKTALAHYDNGEKVGTWEYYDAEGNSSDTPQGDFAEK